MNLFIFLLWLSAGIFTLISPEISKLNYGLVWAMLILELLKNILEELEEKR